MSEHPILDVTELAKSYGDRNVLRGLTFQLFGEEALGLIGPNGAGKTTLLRILLDLIEPAGGAVNWTLGRGRIGHFGGGHTIPPQARADEWSWLVSQGEYRAERRRVRELSRGNRQMLGLRSALASTPSCVLLDEPWEGLDPDGSRWLSQTIQFRRRQGCAFILSSHRLHDLAGMCDRYAFLIDGQLRIERAADIGHQGQVTGDDLLTAFDRLRAAR